MDFAGATAEPIGHLGLIAATIQDSGLMDVVNRQLGTKEGSVKHGHRVAAMILNGLGFINTALYMTPRFFHDKPLDLLLGEGVTAEQLNDDCLGRCLDKIASYGTTKWYSEIALEVVMKTGLLSRMAHLDSTTLSLYGTYDGEHSEAGPKPLQGYSKDHRPDLKQVTLQCVSLGKSALPIWMDAREHDRVLAGTSHLPFLIASALALTVNVADKRLAGPGLKSTFRLAGFIGSSLSRDGGSSLIA